MPFSIRKVGKTKYQVYNTATGELHSKGTTKKKAEGQFRLLQGIHRKETIGLEGGMFNWVKSVVGRHPTLTRRQIEEAERFANELMADPNGIDMEGASILPKNVRKELGEEYYNRQMMGREDVNAPGDASDIFADEIRKQQEAQGRGRRRGLKGGKKWNFSNRNYNPITLGYNALLNGMTENYRNDVTKEGVREDVDRNIEQVKKFAKNPNPITFAKNEAEGQFSRYGSGFYTIPSREYQPRRFL